MTREEPTVGRLPAGAAIERLHYVLDVMNDDESEFAVGLVQSDEIYENPQWTEVQACRTETSNALRGYLDGLMKPQR